MQDTNLMRNCDGCCDTMYSGSLIKVRGWTHVQSIPQTRHLNMPLKSATVGEVPVPIPELVLSVVSQHSGFLF